VYLIDPAKARHQGAGLEATGPGWLHALHLTCSRELERARDPIVRRRDEGGTLPRAQQPRGPTRSGDLWRAAQRKLETIDVAARLNDLTIPAGNRLEKLRSDQAGPHAIRINDQCRVTFRWEEGDAHEVRVQDYH